MKRRARGANRAPRRIKAAKTARDKVECKSCRLQFDVLPAEVLSHIALYALMQGSALSLARVSKPLQHAVVSAYCFSLHLRPYRQRPAQWVSFFAPSIRALILDKAYGRVHVQLVTKAIFGLFKQPSLTYLRMPNRKEFLVALRSATSIRVLHIDVTVHLKDAEELYGALRKPLACMPLEDLTIRCDTHRYLEGLTWTDWEKGDLGCPLHPFWTTSKYLPASCPNVNILRAECDSACASAGRVFRAFEGRVKHLEIWNDISPDLIPDLMSLSSLDFRRMWGGVYSGWGISDLTPLYPVLKGIQRSRIIDAEHLATFLPCSQLQSLDLYLRHGAEQVLNGNFPCLRHLKLSWYSGYIDTPTYEPPRNLLRNMIEGMPQLTSLSLRSVRIARDELLEILGYLGGELREFECCLRKQDEPHTVRLEALLMFIARNNRGLRKLKFSVDHPMSCSGPAQYGEGFLFDEAAARRLEAGIEILRARAPQLDLECVERIVTYLGKLARGQFARWEECPRS